MTPQLANVDRVRRLIALAGLNPEREGRRDRRAGRDGGRPDDRRLLRHAHRMPRQRVAVAAGERDERDQGGAGARRRTAPAKLDGTIRLGATTPPENPAPRHDGTLARAKATPS
jgi:hypothetical protein